MMRNSRKPLLLAFLFVLMAGLCAAHFLTAPRPVAAFSSGPPASRTGAPGEGTCLFCHFSYPLDDPSGGVAIEDLPASYTPGQPIDFTVTVFQDGTDGVRHSWGFELTVLDANNNFVGTLVATDAANTQIISGDVNGSTRDYIEQTSDGTFFDPDGAPSATWTMRWIPPDTDAGPVTFYVAANAADGDGTTQGDYIFTGNQTVAGPAAGAMARAFLSSVQGR